jgi:hypothetical protein
VSGNGAVALEKIDYRALADSLDNIGYAIVPQLIDVATCSNLAAAFDDDERFRSTIDMARYNFGSGVYRYFAAPLPDVVATLRTALYPGLAEIANQWQAALALDARFPSAHADYLERCHQAGQRRPTPLLLRYRPGDFNCLHQDLYGEEVFPLQVAILLSAPGDDFEGGEFVLTEQRPRMQSRVAVVPLRRGDAVVFPVSQRPVAGKRGYYRVNIRHGVSRLHLGERVTLGIIFHDAS